MRTRRTWEETHPTSHTLHVRRDETRGTTRDNGRHATHQIIETGRAANWSTSRSSAHRRGQSRGPPPEETELVVGALQLKEDEGARRACCSLKRRKTKRRRPRRSRRRRRRGPWNDDDDDDDLDGHRPPGSDDDVADGRRARSSSSSARATAATEHQRHRRQGHHNGAPPHHGDGDPIASPLHAELVPVVSRGQSPAGRSSADTLDVVVDATRSDDDDHSPRIP
mmetsp:Transcript_15142/g.60808  ORF Transcript_15142/g.60808 Transcript_15142/m.60808 type:complete len:224 (+) Transcript_15142:144-815(+)